MINSSISRLAETSRLKVTWVEENENEIDGIVQLEREGKITNLKAEVRSVLQASHLPQVLKMRERIPNYIVIAGRISRKLAQELQELRVNYLESGGNAFIETKDFFLLIEGKKRGTSVDRTHLFTNASIQLLYHLMVRPALMTRTYREIASATGASLDNISKSIRALRENGYITALKKGGYAFLNKEGLLERWITEYGDRLKSKLLIGNFRFLRDDHWQDIELDPSKTQWSGEPAIDKTLGELRPQLFTLYTVENKKDLIQKYRLIPDPEGPVSVYRAFWDLNTFNATDCVPELLIYTDLLLSGSARNADAAKKLLDARKETILQSI